MRVQNRIVPDIFKSAAAYEELVGWYERALEHLTVPYETRTVDTRYGETHMIVAGEESIEREPVLLLHGLGTNAAFWWPIIDLLAPQYRLYVLDIIGQPGQSMGGHLLHARSDYSKWLADVLDALSIEQAHIIGHSLGGRLLIKFAAHPASAERIARAVLLGTAGVRPLSIQAFVEMFVFGVLKVLPSKRAAQRLLKSNIAPDSDWNDEQTRELVELLTIYIWQVKKHLEMVLAFGLPDTMLRSVTVPTLLLMGKHDMLYKAVPSIRRARKLMPDLRAETVVRAGHALTWEQPQEVCRRIIEFLDG